MNSKITEEYGAGFEGTKGLLYKYIQDTPGQNNKTIQQYMKTKSLSEILKKSDPVEDWISDFIDSDDARFAGKSKKERINMALGAYYAAQRNESIVGISDDNEINEEPKIIDKRSDKEIEQDKKAYADKKKDKGDIQHGDDALVTASKNEKVRDHLKFLGKSLDQGGARRLLWVRDDKGDYNLMAYRVNHGRLDRDGAKLVMKAPEDVTRVSVQQIIAAVLKVQAPPIKGNDNQVVVKVGSESEARKLIDKVKENNKKVTSKDKKARAALYKRKDGFKVYITGESPAAVSAYKSMAESYEYYDKIDMRVFEEIEKIISESNTKIDR